MRREGHSGQIVIHCKNGDPQSVQIVLTVTKTVSVQMRTFYPTASGVRVVSS